MMIIFRKTLWDAPTTHQIMMAVAMFFLGLIQLLGGKYAVETLPNSHLLFNKPIASLECAFAVMGIFTALVDRPEWCFKLRMGFCLFNVAHFTAIAYVFGGELRVGTVIYPVMMMWSVWLLFRVAFDRRIIVELLRKRSQR